MMSWRTRIIALVHDLDIRIVDAASGEILRHLTLNPNIDYKPTGAPKGPTRPAKTKQLNPQVEGSAVSDVSRHHNGRNDRI